MDDVVGDHSESDPAPDAARSFIQRSPQPMPAFENTDATFTPGAPFLKVLEPTLLLPLLAGGLAAAAAIGLAWSGALRVGAALALGMLEQFSSWTFSNGTYVDAVLVDEQGDIAPDAAERLRGLTHLGVNIGVVGDAEWTQVLGDERLGPLPDDDLQAEIGKPFGEEALRCADEEDRLLHQPAPAHEANLLATVLGVVARVGLVGDQLPERGAQHGEIHVDRHPALQPAQVVVEAGPGLVGDELEVDVLTFRQPELSVGPLAQILGERVDGRLQLVDRYRLRLAPLDVPVAQRTRTGQDLVEATVGLGEVLVRYPPGTDAVARLDLVGVADRLAREARSAGALVAHGAQIASFAARSVGRDRIAAGAGRGIARALEMARAPRRAMDLDAAARSRLARVRQRAAIKVVAGGPVDRERIGAEARQRIARPGGAAGSVRLAAAARLTSISGLYRLRLDTPHGEAIVAGTYREITPPSKLVFSWQWQDDEDWVNLESEITCEFHAHGNETELTFTQVGFPSAESRGKHEHGWGGCLDKLDAYLAS